MHKTKYKKLNNDHFLSRLPLTEKQNAESIDSLKIIENFCSLGNRSGMQKLFRDFCKASMNEKYAWSYGTPGNCIFISEELEKLIEAAFILTRTSSNKSLTKISPKKSGHVSLPMSLTKEELDKPLQVFHDFFSHQSLPRWKLELHKWMEAAISNFSVTDLCNPRSLLPFVKCAERLIDASYQLAGIF